MCNLTLKIVFEVFLLLDVLPDVVGEYLPEHRNQVLHREAIPVLQLQLDPLTKVRREIVRFLALREVDEMAAFEIGKFCRSSSVFSIESSPKFKAIELFAEN